MSPARTAVAPPPRRTAKQEPARRQAAGKPVALTKSERLRALLKRAGPVQIAGAHSPLSARLVERAGFDAIWASSFEISAAHGVPDASIITMAEQLDAARRMNDAVSIPVLADCDNGFGNAINVIRAVQEYEAAGIAGICIEDNIFPKRCSFYAGVQRELVSIEEHAGKIRAAKAAQRSESFLVFARTEALIAGWGQEEALRRARAYAEAGADGIVIHSKSSTPDEVQAFAAKWDGRCPLIAIPTTYKHASAQELDRAGFKVVIFANHALRSSLKAMQRTLETLRREGRAVSVDAEVATLGEVEAVIGVSEMRANEEQFLPRTEQAKAIILAAGFEKALLPLTADRPKGMLDINGKPLLQRQVETLQRCGVRDIVVVRGYKKDAVKLPGVRFIDNDDYAKTHILASLFSAKEAFSGRCLVLYADLLFDHAIVEKLLAAQTDIALAIDRAWDPASQQARAGSPAPDLVMTDGASARGHRFMPSHEPSRVLQIGQTLDAKKANGEFIGIASVSGSGASRLSAIYDEVSRRGKGKPFHEAESVVRAGLTDLLQEAIDRGDTIRAVDIYKGWMEIDTLDDYERVKAASHPA